MEDDKVERKKFPVTILRHVIKNKRKSCNISLEEMSRLTGIDLGYLSRIENGFNFCNVNDPESSERYKKLCITLGLDFEWFKMLANAEKNMSAIKQAYNNLAYFVGEVKSDEIGRMYKIFCHTISSMGGWIGDFEKIDSICPRCMVLVPHENLVYCSTCGDVFCELCKPKLNHCIDCKYITCQTF